MELEDNKIIIDIVEKVVLYGDEEVYYASDGLDYGYKNLYANDFYDKIVMTSDGKILTKKEFNGNYIVVLECNKILIVKKGVIV